MREECQIDFCRSLCAQGIFLIDCQLSEDVYDLQVCTIDASYTIAPCTLEAIRERKVALYMCAHLNSVFLCPYGEHKPSYVYRHFPAFEVTTFICPECANVRKDLQEKSKLANV